MTTDPEKANKLKEDGNRQFVLGHYVAAESLYSKAIIADYTNSALFTNRAMARLKLTLHGAAIADCRAALDLVGPNMKAHFIYAQCLLALCDYDGALTNAKLALDLGVAKNDKSLTQITSLVRECRRLRWDAAEKQRRRESQDLEQELVALMEREKDQSVALCDNDVDRDIVADEWRAKAQLLRNIFENARTAGERKREVPDWLLDDISFDVLIDPVMTKTGQSYERASILEALKRQPIDPLTREPLHPEDLRPNIALRKACEEFLDEHGWAVDW